MKIYIISFIVLFCFSLSFTQNVYLANELVNPLSGTHKEISKDKTKNKITNDAELVDSMFNCETDFFTIDGNGIIQNWSFINDSTIEGGDTVLTGGGISLAYCGDMNSPLFYSGNFPESGVSFYDEIDGWQSIPTTALISNNAGHGSHHYCMGVVSNVNRILYYFEGNELIIVDSLVTNSFAVADLAVDEQGQAWVFVGEFTEVSSLSVYNSSGLITTYDIAFNSAGAYGSFFLNDVLYVAIEDSIRPVIIDGNNAELGEPITFPNFDFLDMASCQNDFCVNSNSMQTISSCDDYLSPSGQYLWTSSGTYFDTIPNNQECDSLITIDLTINTVNAAVLLNGNTLSSEAIGAVYQWLDCNDSMNVIEGETSQDFIPLSSGNYAVEVTENGCIDTSSCVFVETVGIVENLLEQDFVVFPNPNQGDLYIEFEGIQKNLKVDLISMSGQLIQTKRIIDSSIIHLEMNQPNGIYLIEISDESGKKAMLKILKNEN